jgi:UDP:flavonoid glycosyltransferase YjiC (YdhE family)
MEPFLAIGQILKSKGHRVICLFPEQFKNLVLDSGFLFESLGTEFIEMLESDLGKFALGGGGSKLKKFIAYYRLAKIQRQNNELMFQKQMETMERLKPDKTVHNGKVFYPVIWELSNPNSTILVSPVPYLNYQKGHAHLAFNRNYGEFLNKLTYKIADWGIVKAIMSLVKQFKLPNTSKDQVKRVLKTHKTIYTISPQLVDRPPEWPENVQVLGYHERDKTTNWTPSESLQAFLQNHNKILFVTFGSMTNPQPEAKTKIIMDILERNQIPAILNTSTGGLSKPETYNTDLFHFVEHIPYDWIFPKMYGVIHHGGSGTTHMAVKYGCVSLIIPHIIDQFAWNDILFKKEVGPKGMKISQISTRVLEPKIVDLYQNPVYKENAKALAVKMDAEAYLADELYREIVE